MANPPGLWRYLTLIALVVLLGVGVPASASTIVDEEVAIYTDTGGFRSLAYTPSGSTNKVNLNSVTFTNIQNHPDVPYIIIEFSGNRHGEGVYTDTYSLEGISGTAVIHVTHSRNLVGAVTKTRYTIFPQNWDTGTLTGKKSAVFGQNFVTNINGYSSGIYNWENDLAWITNGGTTVLPIDLRCDLTVASTKVWKNHLLVTDDLPGGYQIQLTRVYGSKAHASTIELYQNAVLQFTNGDITDFEHLELVSRINNIKLLSGTDTYSWNLEAQTQPDPTTAVANVYIKNSQTGALLTDAHIEIQDTTTDPWTEVINQTLPSGQGTISLPKDSGIHLTQYHIGATVPGYQQVVPALFFRVVGPTNVVVEMEPVEGGPVNEDNTYLEFYVRDLNANGIPNANVLVDGQLRWTNAQGYTQFEVAKNASYPYSVSKSGYMTIQGSAIVLDGPRYVANVVLGPGTVPTYTPTSGPGETPGGPGATPTPDSRSSAEKAASGLDFLLDNAENFGIMAAMILLVYMGYWMVPKK